MTMTMEEMLRHYRLAKDKKEDIQVLAELNAVSAEHMRKLLREAGAELPDGRRKSGKKKEKKLMEEQTMARAATGAQTDTAKNSNEEEFIPIRWETGADGTTACPPEENIQRKLARVCGDIGSILFLVEGSRSQTTRTAAENLCLSMMRDLLEEWAGSGRREVSPYDEKA